jgi:hypothetical protein
MIKPKHVQYGVWEVDSGADPMGYWMLYDTVEDAVSDKGDGTRVYKLEAKSIGQFKRAVTLEKVKRPKRKK